MNNLKIALKLYRAGAGTVASLTTDWNLTDEDALEFMAAVKKDWADGLYKDRRVMVERRNSSVVARRMCPATISHGPGHQSKTNCQVEGPHSTHYAIYGSYDQKAEWDGDHVFSGFMDEPPEFEL